MTNCSYIKLKQAELDDPIYRIIPLKRLCDLFRSRSNVLTRPSRWDDPFENFVLNSPLVLPNGEVGRAGFNNDFYGQCWTKRRRSDAMWRIYSPNTTSVRIRTTIRKLGEALAASCGDLARDTAFVGRVSYLKDKALKKFGDEIFADGLSTSATAETLLVKRLAFDHEREIRLLYFSPELENRSDFHPYPIDPHTMIEQIMIDPRINKERGDRLKVAIRDHTGFAGPIKRSLLYTPPKDFVFPIGLG